jgi:histidyl-tRNA synthetase
MFGGKDMSGVGISFGVERIYDILEEMNGFPEGIATSTKALIINFDEQSETAGWPLLMALRSRNIAAEIYPVPAKLKKQMSYADKKQIPYVIFIGAEEIASGMITLKSMASGDQQLLTTEDLFSQLR